MNAEDTNPRRMIDLDLLGLPTDCWKCRRSTVALVAISPSGSRDDDDPFQTDEPKSLAFAAAHLPPGVSQVGEIKVRASRTAGENYLSNGCVHCDALLGNFFLFQEELPELLVTEGTSGLILLGSVSVPLAEWETAWTAKIS